MLLCDSAEGVIMKEALHYHESCKQTASLTFLFPIYSLVLCAFHWGSACYVEKDCAKHVVMSFRMQQQ